MSKQKTVKHRSPKNQDISKIERKQKAPLWFFGGGPGLFGPGPGKRLPQEPDAGLGRSFSAHRLFVFRLCFCHEYSKYSKPNCASADRRPRTTNYYFQPADLHAGAHCKRIVG